MMKKLPVSLALATAVALFTTGMVAKPLSAEIRQIDGLQFKRVLVVGSVEVEVSQNPETSLQVKGKTAELDQQPFYVMGETLVLGASTKKTESSFADIKFRLAVPELTFLELQGSGDVYVRPFEAGDIELAVKGAGDLRSHSIQGADVILRVSGSGDLVVARMEARGVDLQLSGSGDLHVGTLTAQAVEASLNGSGDISVQKSGFSQEIDLNVVGSGDIDFKALDSTRAEVNIFGSGTVRVGQTEELGANVVGSGDVFYRGAPRVNRNVLGSGMVEAD